MASTTRSPSLDPDPPDGPPLLRPAGHAAAAATLAQRVSCSPGEGDAYRALKDLYKADDTNVSKSAAKRRFDPEGRVAGYLY